MAWTDQASPAPAAGAVDLPGEPAVVNLESLECFTKSKPAVVASGVSRLGDRNGAAHAVEQWEPAQRLREQAWERACSHYDRCLLAVVVAYLDLQAAMASSGDLASNEAMMTLGAGPACGGPLGAKAPPARVPPPPGLEPMPGQQLLQPCRRPEQSLGTAPQQPPAHGQELFPACRRPDTSLGAALPPPPVQGQTSLGAAPQPPPVRGQALFPACRRSDVSLDAAPPERSPAAAPKQPRASRPGGRAEDAADAAAAVFAAGGPKVASPQAPHVVERAKQPAQVGNKRRKCNFVFLVARRRLEAFGLVPRIIGPGGQHMRSIAEACNGKVRIRGKGSGYLEGRAQKEARIPLQVALSCRCDEDFRKGREMLTGLLDSFADLFAAHCHEQGVSGPNKFYAIVDG